MAAANYIRKNINLFVDGRGYAGQIEDFTPPKLSLITEDFRGGGMNAPVEIVMGMEKLETSFTMKSFDPNLLKLFNVTQGSIVPFIAREALESNDGTITPVVHTMRGKVKEIDQGTLKPGEIGNVKLSMGLHYYKLEIAGEIVQEIDVENMVQTISGTDALAAVRGALGM